MLKRTASRWPPAQYPASCSCEDAGWLSGKFPGSRRLRSRFYCL